MDDKRNNMTNDYTCLILDHDDTAVNSTATIHYPAHLKVMEELRPGYPPISLKGWFEKNFDPGIMEYMTDELGFTEKEVRREYEIWRDFTTSRVPAFYPGFLEIIRRFKDRGGIVTVVSHSEEELIMRDYASVDVSKTVVPDLVFGWDFDAEKRKPHPWPVEQILQHFNLQPDQVLIIDDLRPGVLMSKETGVDIAAAGWGHDIPVIRDYMRQHSVAYFSRVEELADFLFRSDINGR